MPQQFRIGPCCISRRANTPRSNRVFKVRSRRERVPKESNVQRLLGRFDQTIERRIQRRVIVVMRSAASQYERFFGSLRRSKSACQQLAAPC